MRFFTYKATDAKGQPANGTIQAATADDARLALVRAGWTVYEIQPSGSQPAATAPKQAAAPQPAARVQPSRPQPAPHPSAAAGPGQIILGSPSAASPIPQAQAAARPAASAKQTAPQLNNAPTTHPRSIRTKIGSDKERFFLFSQLAAAFRSGMNPVTTFQEVASRSRDHFHDSLEALAKAAVEGGSLARTMAMYPDLYPESVVGMTEAGQQGGFLPDAFEQISLQAQAAHKFKRWFFWIWFLFVNTILVIPGTWWATSGIVKGWENIDATGGASGGGGVAKAFWQTLIWPTGPAFIVLCLFCWATYSYFGSRLAKRFRHRTGLRAPIYGKRARHENLSIFSWTLARLSHSGLPPSKSYQLAAETVPNLEMRDELRELAGRLSGAEKMSQIIGGSRLFPDEYVPIIATAEYTGDLPGALQQLSDMSRNEYQAAETYAKMRSGCWGLLALFIVGAIAMIILINGLYYQLPAKILKDT